MNEENIVKKKRKNYYNHRHNQNKNYYYKNKKTKKNLLLENNDSEEVKNILLFNENEIEEEKEIKPREIVQVIKENIPDYEEMDYIPIKKNKKKNIFQNNYFRFGLGFTIILIAVIGVSYSFFNYTGEDTRNADIASGEVYVRLVEDEQSITLNKMYPRTDEEARSRSDNYFDFTIKAKNTSNTKSILYSINIENGNNISGKTRIDSKYIKLDLQKKVNDEYIYVLEGVKLNSYSFTDVVMNNTNNEITKEYRLRIWISDDIIISDTESNATYTQSEFANLFANFNITVNSKDVIPAYSMLAKNADTETLINFANVSSSTNGKGLYRLLGTENDNYPIYYYRGDVDNNNVVFGGFCWQIVRTTDTGGIKMIYNGLPDVTGSGDSTTYNCGINRSIPGVIRSRVDLSANYYYADDYEIVSTSGNGAKYKLKSKNNPITQVAISDATAAASAVPTIAANYPYTCARTTQDATCATILKVYSYASETKAFAYMSLGKTIIGASAFNSNNTSVSDVGYMSNVRYASGSGLAESGSIFGKDIEWDGTNYLVIEDIANSPSTNSTLDDNHHYTCGTAGATICTSVRYYYYHINTGYNYITLTNGDLIEDALYKMTGNGSAEIKMKYANYRLNVNNSTIKTIIDSWFRTNLTSEVNGSNPAYNTYLEDTIYCNDRSYVTIGENNYMLNKSGWNPAGGVLSLYRTLYFGTFNRYDNNWYSETNVPNMTCPNKMDQFTVFSANGNGALAYPVGLLTVDEIILAGAGYENVNNYLYINYLYWTMSPSGFDYNGAVNFFMSNTGRLDGDNNVKSSWAIRPVVSLKLGTEFLDDGDGTPTNPYIVKYN